MKWGVVRGKERKKHTNATLMKYNYAIVFLFLFFLDWWVVHGPPNSFRNCKRNSFRSCKRNSFQPRQVCRNLAALGRSFRKLERDFAMVIGAGRVQIWSRRHFASIILNLRLHMFALQGVIEYLCMYKCARIDGRVNT